MEYKLKCNYNRNDKTELKVTLNTKDTILNLSFYVHPEETGEEIEAIWWYNKSKNEVVYSSYESTVKAALTSLEIGFEVGLEDIIFIENMLKNVLDDVNYETCHMIKPSFPKQVELRA
jgi:hypothetical protein